MKTDAVNKPLAPIPIPLDGLSFGFLARNDGLFLPGIVTLKSNSPPNVATLSQLRVVINGLPPANITSIYPKSAVAHFALRELLIGCATASTGSVFVGGDPTLPTVIVPQTCTLLFEGRSSKGKDVDQTCSYGGLGPVNGKLAQCVLGPDFGDLVAVNITVQSSFTAKEAIIVAIEDVIHTNYYK